MARFTHSSFKKIKNLQEASQGVLIEGGVGEQTDLENHSTSVYFSQIELQHVSQHHICVTAN